MDDPETVFDFREKVAAEFPQKIPATVHAAGTPSHKVKHPSIETMPSDCDRTEQKEMLQAKTDELLK
ncbi:hypothetical protein FPRO04_12229 [Fusarium proliferatum]|nr:hypothetical protein FPRO04_12229 [Fusarium proliferatum]